MCIGNYPSACVETVLTGTPTIRHVECTILTEHERCQPCKDHRKSLHAMLCRQDKLQPTENRTAPDSHVNYCCLTPSETKERMSRLHQEVRSTKEELATLTARLEKFSDNCGENIDVQTHHDLITIMETRVEEIHQRFPSNTFQRLFWDQQLKAARLKSPSAMRWNPLMIKWCIYLCHLSSGGYEALRKSGCISLPSQRTLRDYTHVANVTSGFSSDVDLQLIEAAKLTTCPEHEKCVVVLMDEMHMRESLVYDKASGTHAYTRIL